MPRRNRILKPEFFEDEALARTAPRSRLLYQGMWIFGDDEGNGRGHPDYLRSCVFPFEPRVRIIGHLRELQEIGKAFLYEVDGERYYHLPNFKKHQRINRPSPPVYPPPPKAALEEYLASTAAHGALSEPSVSPQNSSSKKRIEENRREPGSEGSVSDQGEADPLQAIFDLWLELKIVKHDEFRPEIRRAVKAALKNYGEEGVIRSMRIYAEIYHGEQYYWSHQWTLEEFCKRGIKKFVDFTPEQARENYLADKGRRAPGKRRPSKQFKEGRAEL